MLVDVSKVQGFNEGWAIQNGVEEQFLHMFQPIDGSLLEKNPQLRIIEHPAVEFFHQGIDRFGSANPVKQRAVVQA